MLLLLYFSTSTRSYDIPPLQLPPSSPKPDPRRAHNVPREWERGERNDRHSLHRPSAAPQRCRAGLMATRHGLNCLVPGVRGVAGRLWVYVDEPRLPGTPARRAVGLARGGDGVICRRLPTTVLIGLDTREVIEPGSGMCGIRSSHDLLRPSAAANGESVMKM